MTNTCTSVTTAVECLTANVDNCIETVTVTEDLETVLASPGTLCLRCDFGSGASIDTTFQIDSSAVDDRVGSTVNGMLVVYDTEKVFDSRTPRNVKCSNGGSSFNAATFLWSKSNIYNLNPHLLSNICTSAILCSNTNWVSGDVLISLPTNHTYQAESTTRSM